MALHRLLFLPLLCALAEVLPYPNAHRDTLLHNINSQLRSREDIYSEKANQGPVEFVITARELNKLRMAFRALGVEGTVLAPLLMEEAANVSIHAEPSLSELIETVEHSQRLKQNLKVDFMKKAVPKQNGGSHPGNVESKNTNPETENEIESTARVEYENQVGGYEGCRRDYASFIEPLTDIILYGMHQEMCAEDPSFCNKTGTPHPPYRDLESWAGPMLDSLGKLPAAATDGQLHWSGSFDMCKEVHAEYQYYNHTYMEPGVYLEDRQFHGEYCRVTISRSGSQLPDIIKGLHIGICVPDTCDYEDVMRYVWTDNIALRSFVEDGLGSNVSHIWCGYDLDRSTDRLWQFIIVVCILTLIVGIVSGLYDRLYRRKLLEKYSGYLRPSLGAYTGKSTPTSTLNSQQEMQGKERGKNEAEPVVDFTPGRPTTPYRQFSSVSTVSGKIDIGEGKPGLSRQTSTSGVPLFGAAPSVYDLEFVKPTWLDRLELAFVGFSFYSNTARIFSTKTKKDRLDVIDGIRFYSFLWMILGHTWIMGPVYADMWLSMNLVRVAMTLPKEFTFQYILNYHLHSDTFLVISGTLVSYWWLKRYAEEGKLGRRFIAHYFLHRYWSLMPVAMLSMVFILATYKYILPHGVFVPDGTPDIDHCEYNWWRNFLFIHNLFRDNQCMTWSLYFGILWQLHCVSIIVLIPLVLKPWLGYVFLACFWLIHIGATAGVTANIYTEGGFVRHFLDWYFEYFQAPWCRAGPFIVGLALGIILFNTKCVYKMHWLVSLAGWLVSMTLLFTVAYVTYDQYREDGEIWSSAGLVAYDTLSRTAWGLGIAWIIFACATGHGNVVTMFLSLKIYQPLCRLTLPAFFFHGVVIIFRQYSQSSPVYIYIKEINYTFLANIFMVFLAGYVIAILFHYPYSIGLERAVLCNNKLQAIMSGCHPADDIIRYAEDNYFGSQYQPWSLIGATGGEEPPPEGDSEFEMSATTSSNGAEVTRQGHESQQAGCDVIKEEDDVQHDEVTADEPHERNTTSVM